MKRRCQTAKYGGCERKLEVSQYKILPLPQIAAKPAHSYAGRTSAPTARSAFLNCRAASASPAYLCKETIMKAASFFLLALLAAPGLTPLSGHLAHAAGGDAAPATLNSGPTPEERAVRRQPRVGVWRYAMGPGARGRDTHISYGKDSGVHVARTYGSPELGLAVANSLSQHLAASRRFEVVSRASLEEAADEDIPTNAAAALDAGRALGLDYVLYGEVESASTDLDRTGDSGKDKKNSGDVRYTTRARATIHHVAVDVKSGQIFKEARDNESREETHFSFPAGSSWRSLFSKLADRSAERFARNLVPERKGRVLAVRQDGSLVIGLGRLDGVGEDTDFWFERPEVLRDRNGVVVMDEAGQPLLRTIRLAAAPSAKHDAMPAAGRPVEIEDEFTIVQVGYRGSGGFLGLDHKFKASAAMALSLRVGDTAVLSTRVGK